MAFGIELMVGKGWLSEVLDFDEEPGILAAKCFGDGWRDDDDHVVGVAARVNATNDSGVRFALVARVIEVDDGTDGRLAMQGDGIRGGFYVARPIGCSSLGLRHFLKCGRCKLEAVLAHGRGESTHVAHLDSFRDAVGGKPAYVEYHAGAELKGGQPVALEQGVHFDLEAAFGQAIKSVTSFDLVKNRRTRAIFGKVAPVFDDGRRRQGDGHWLSFLQGRGVA